MPKNGETTSSMFGDGKLMVSDFSLFTTAQEAEMLSRGWIKVIL
jgi:hypothetical protein